MTERVVVIGSNSFSGAHFVDALIAVGGYDVLGISRSAEYPAVMLPYRRHARPPFRFERADLNLDFERICGLIDEFHPTYVVNFAGQGEVRSSFEFPVDYYRTNALSTVRLVNHLARRVSLKRYLHISTPEVYGSSPQALTESEGKFAPVSPYAASKAAADMFLTIMAKEYAFPAVMVRSTNVYGSHQQLYRIIPRTVIYLKTGKTIRLNGGGRSVKAYIDIRDVAVGQILALIRGELGSVYHLASDQGIAVRDVVEKICRMMGHDFAKATEDVPHLHGAENTFLLNSDRARARLGWRPEIDLDRGLGDVVRWIEANWAEIRGLPHDYIHQP